MKELDTYLLHKQVYLPQGIIDEVYKHQDSTKIVEFSYHFIVQHLDKYDYKHYLNKNTLVKIVKNLHSQTPFEVEISKEHRVLKYVVRTTYDATRDVSIVIIPRGDVAFVKTAWLNDENDKHFTLDKSKYVRHLD